MGSKASAATTTSTTNLALDRSATVGEGTAILDSIIVDPSDTVMIETIAQHRATFETLTANSTIQLEEILNVGSQVLELADRQQVRLEGMIYEQLRTGVEFLETAKEQGKFVVEFAELVVSDSFNLAGSVVDDNSDLAAQALDIARSVKTGDQGSMVKYVTTLIAVFGVAAIYLSTRE